MRTSDPVGEELPQEDNESDSGEYVAQQNLCQNGPVEKAAIRRVSRVPVSDISTLLGAPDEVSDIRVDTMLDQGVIIVLDSFDHMRERDGGVNHSERPESLSSQQGTKDWSYQWWPISGVSR